MKRFPAKLSYVLAKFDGARDWRPGPPDYEAEAALLTTLLAEAGLVVVPRDGTSGHGGLSGAQAREDRILLGLTPTQLAELTGLARPTIASFEEGARVHESTERILRKVLENAGIGSSQRRAILGM